MVFFTPDLLLDEPDWLKDGQRGSELSDDFVWVPFVTMWQVLTDMTAGTSVPDGYGHLYSPAAHVDAWVAVLDPDDWTDPDTARLKAHLSP